jgi:DNA-3-methyladenine glycosylase
VARALLGKVLVRRCEGEWLSGRIVEVEAYCGLDDEAAHAFAGKTRRNAVLFGPPGFAYVYFIYGMHYCLNISCEPEGQAGSLLLRALEPLEGQATMARLRGVEPGSNPRLLASGPGRLCQALGITRDMHNGVDVTDRHSGLHVEDDGFDAGEIDVLPRVGIRKAADLPLRFALTGNRFVSG